MGRAAISFGIQEPWSGDAFVKSRTVQPTFRAHEDIVGFLSKGLLK